MSKSCTKSELKKTIGLLVDTVNNNRSLPFDINRTGLIYNPMTRWIFDSDQFDSEVDIIDLASYCLSLKYLLEIAQTPKISVHTLTWWLDFRDKNQRTNDFAVWSQPNKFILKFKDELDEHRKAKELAKQRTEEKKKKERDQYYQELANLKAEFPTLVDSLQAARIAAGAMYLDAPVPPLEAIHLRSWWHDILRTHGKLDCYGMIIALPGDIQVVSYLQRYGKELHLLSGDWCGLLILTDQGYWKNDFESEFWKKIVNDHIWNGFCLEIAKLFEIKFNDFPCLLLFEDIRSDNFVAISLKGLDVEEITQRMRNVFDVIKPSPGKDANPIRNWNKHKRIEGFRQTGQTAFGKTKNFVGNTVTAITEAAIKAFISSP